MRWILPTLFLAISFSSAAEPACAPRAGSCDFYRCQERQVSCGQKGYWLNYGDTYCRSFLENEPAYDPETRAWLRSVRYCLQAQSLRLAEQASSCESLRQEAISGHIECYITTGFCDLHARNQLAVIWRLKAAATEWQTWQELGLISKACLNR